MSLSYDPLWETLEQLNISKMEFARRIEISNATLAKLGKNEPVTLTIIDKICDEFNCGIEKIVKHISSNNEHFISEDELVIGTIVLSSCSPLGTDAKTNVTSSPSLKVPCVILKQFNQHYLIAPLSYKSNPDTILDYPFQDIKIEGNCYNGYVQLGKMGHKTSKSFEKIIGKIPLHYMNTITNHLTDIKPLLCLYPQNKTILDNFFSD